MSEDMDTRIILSYVFQRCPDLCVRSPEVSGFSPQGGAANLGGPPPVRNMVRPFVTREATLKDIELVMFHMFFGMLLV